MSSALGSSPVRITRRTVVLGLGAVALAGSGSVAYGVGVEPMRLAVTRYRIRPMAPWPEGLSLRIVAVSDVHACDPFMKPEHIRRIVDLANGLGGDVIVLLGDYVRGTRAFTTIVAPAEWAPVLGALKAPLGTYAILGNHDWWADRAACERGHGPTLAGEALTGVGIRVLQNEALPLRVRGHEVWLAGLGDQLSFQRTWWRYGFKRMGSDDLPATLAAIPKGASSILLAHEPDIFPQVPAHVALTLSGHTHGGQVRLLGYAPVVPSRYGRRYAYGHVREQTDLVVSGGLGMSGLPIRLGITPEIVVVDLSSEAIA
ncbi:metallophosphoesterase [Methylobacterium marchantiae]|uniref:Metallophosphoesterase n=1 Tax=Methylobacterium marchantiae TaxID=600331 RepID=A0ABW3WU30_9HYPH|nr:hypothetical protein AIGOOFII_0949 [Methylobacterium marchantiae]